MASYKKRKNPKASSYNIRFHDGTNRSQYKPSMKKARIEITPAEKGIIIKQFGRNGEFKRAAFQSVGGELTPAFVTDGVVTVEGVRVSLPPAKSSIIKPSLGIKPTHSDRSIPVKVVLAKPNIRRISIRHKEVMAASIDSLKVKDITYPVPGLRRVGELVQSKDSSVRRIALALPPSHPDYRVIQHALNQLSWDGGQGPVPDFDDGEKPK